MSGNKSDVFFKGYVPTINKKCTMQFKDKNAADLMTLDQVEQFPEYAGILAEDTVLIDVDDKEQSDILFEIVDKLALFCRVYETTRGKHFLFKRGSVDRCGTHKRLAIGLESDIKAGNKNSYEVLKFKGKNRPVLYDINPGEEYQECPKWLYAIGKTDINFLTMASGDGRNQALFNYILTLQSNGFTSDEARATIQIINDFVLSDPLPEKELNTILRDDAFKKPCFFKGSTFLFDKFATWLKNECHILRINGELYVYDGAIYRKGKTVIQSKMIEYIPNLKSSQRREVWEYLELIVDTWHNDDMSNYIAFKNGVYDLVNCELIPFSPSVVVTNKINYNYNESATSSLLTTTLNKLACGNPNIKALLEEMAGYCLYTRNELRKCFILTGDKKNGKSTFLDLVVDMLGQENISTLDLADIGGQFRTAELVGKLANIGDDIGDDFIKNPAIFKKVVSGDRITAEHKGQDPFSFANYSKLLFSANEIPRIKDRSGAVLDRLIIVPFNATFDKNDPDFDPFIKYKLRKPEVIEAFIQLAIDGLYRVLDNQGFTEDETIRRELEEYADINNPIRLFFKEMQPPCFINRPTEDCFTEYQEFCIRGNFNPLTKIEFCRVVRRAYKLDIVVKKISGKTVRIFIEKDS